MIIELIACIVTAYAISYTIYDFVTSRKERKNG